MSTSQFKKRTTYLDLPGKVHDLYQHVVKHDRSAIRRNRELKNLEISPSWTNGFTKKGDKTFGFLIILDGPT